MFKNKLNMFDDLKERVPLNVNMYDTIVKARDYDIGAARDQLLYPMERMVSILMDECKQDMKLLNIGSETGILAIILAGRCPGISITGIENNAMFMQVAAENLKLLQLASSPVQLQFEQGNLCQIPGDDSSYDIVFGNNVLYRCEDPGMLLRECSRLCKQDGLIFLYELVRDADKDKLQFVNQYIKEGKEEFRNVIRASYTKDEISQLLKVNNLSNWHVIPEQLSLRITSRNINVMGNFSL